MVVATNSTHTKVVHTHCIRCSSTRVPHEVRQVKTLEYYYYCAVKRTLQKRMNMMKERNNM